MKLLFVIVVLLVLYLFMICPRMFSRPDRTGFTCNVCYAHRGLYDNHSEAPENSLAAFKKAVEAGYGMELDVHLSKDEIPVVFHDADLKRMCGVDGKVCEYTLEELQEFKLAGSKETIPTFESVLELVNGRTPLIVEYKLDTSSTKVCEISDKLLQNYKGLYCIESFHPFAVLWYKKHRPDIVRGQLSREFHKDKDARKQPWFFALSFLLTNVFTRPDFVAYDFHGAKNISRRLFKWLGGLSAAYTIQSQEQLDAMQREFDVFIFDSFVPGQGK